MRHALAQFAKLTFQPIKPRFQRLDAPIQAGFQRREYRETLRKVYDDSSRAVHGGKLKHAAKNQELVSGGQDICRKGILKRLEEPEKPKWEELILGPGL